MVDEYDDETIEMVIDEPSDITESPKETAVKPIRDPVTGQFLKGCPAGPGRPKGSKDKLNVQVIETLEKLWQARGQELVEQLAAEKPEVVMAMISRMIPQQLATEAITGEEMEKGEGNQQDITIRLVQQAAEPALPPREVEGELMPPETTH